jgi:succinyl-CoA synthetase beta subunit
MNTHEYQAKEILQKYGVPIPPFGVARSPQEAAEVVDALHLTEAVVKIQVHAGGRGKAGGVKFAKGKEQIVQVATQLLGMKLVNAQTGPAGVIAHQVLISSATQIHHEYYLGALIDREGKCPLLIASPEGGMEIEEVAATRPDRILKIPIELSGAVRPFRLLHLCRFMGWTGDAAREGSQIAAALARALIDTDASLLEINPLVSDRQGKLWALDAKLAVDDNALFRQKAIKAYYDPTQDSPQDVEARESDLAYIALSGTIGCMVNGAGLAMATMDLIQHCGGKPANFLDVGGGASKEKVARGFSLILKDPQVKAVLVNIFGGIMNCATLAEGIIDAVREKGIRVPLIVRMEGTNVEEGRRLLKHSGLAILSVDDLQEAAQTACQKGK